MKKLLLILVATAVLSPRANAGVGEGQELYDAYCQVCHGGLGEGQTMGKSLTDNSARNLSDQALLAVITEGRSGTGMAAWGSSFSDTEILDVASYIRVLQGGTGLTLFDEAATVSDDPQVLAGEQLFSSAGGCVTCHSYRDQGGSVGPALDGVASRLGEEGLLQALRNPSATIADGYQAKIVEQPDGSVIRGRFRNDSELAVQIQSADGARWVTYFKARVSSITDAEESLMPEIFSTLDAEQQQNLLAFLKSL
ncbi:MAG: c-type cytochrome [Gammaproteobacteria bacterium]